MLEMSHKFDAKDCNRKLRIRRCTQSVLKLKTYHLHIRPSKSYPWLETRDSPPRPGHKEGNFMHRILSCAVCWGQDAVTKEHKFQSHTELGSNLGSTTYQLYDLGEVLELVPFLFHRG